MNILRPWINLEIQNKEAKSGQWKLGRVMEVHLSLDGYVRKATVGYKINPGGSKYQNKDYTRVIWLSYYQLMKVGMNPNLLLRAGGGGGRVKR